MKKITNLIIIDASSSMQSKADEVRDGIRDLLKDIRKDSKKNKEIKNRTIICQFSSAGRFEVLLNSSKRKKLKDSSVADSYRPSGMTALYDAIGQGFNLIRPNQDGVFINIITDGQENDSKEFESSQIKELITAAKDKNWGVTFMGTTEEAVQNAQSWGISRGNTMQFMDSSAGVLQSNLTRGAARTAYYSSVVDGSLERGVSDNLIADQENEGTGDKG